MHITFDLLTIIVGYILLLRSIIYLQLPLTSASTFISFSTTILNIIFDLLGKYS